MRHSAPAFACIRPSRDGSSLGAERPGRPGWQRGRRCPANCGAFAACSAIGPDAAETLGQLRRVWDLDTAGTRKMLLEAGLSDGFVTALLTRFALDKVTPGITDAKALHSYCEAMRDWLTRYLQFRYITPQAEIRRRLAQR